MSVNLEAVKFNQAVLTSNDGERAIEISPYISSFDYFEDILQLLHKHILLTLLDSIMVCQFVVEKDLMLKLQT
jgi:hypothetical protein